MKILVVGAGISGASIARLLADKGHSIHVIDKREHIAGNCFDYIHETGIRIHKYGPHLFHTSNKRVFDWLQEFSDWIPYQHRVKALLSSGKFVTLPVNAETLKIVGSKEKAINTFFKPYTQKMWGMTLEEISPDVLSRVPIRDDFNELYFPNDKYQALPKDGYSELIKNILSHKNITLRLRQSFSHEVENDYDLILNSMPIDDYFNHKHGRLPYRSIKFHLQQVHLPVVLLTATVNFTHDGPYTRVTEWHLLPNSPRNNYSTLLTFEEPCDYRDNNWEPFYPVKDIKQNNLKLYRSYLNLVPKNMIFIGRCGTYHYIDMDKAIEQSFNLSEKIQ